MVISPFDFHNLYVLTHDIDSSVNALKACLSPRRDERCFRGARHKSTVRANVREVTSVNRERTANFIAAKTYNWAIKTCIIRMPFLQPQNWQNALYNPALTAKSTPRFAAIKPALGSAAYELLNTAGRALQHS
jgi:hypothetical protein